MYLAYAILFLFIFPGQICATLHFGELEPNKGSYDFSEGKFVGPDWEQGDLFPFVIQSGVHDPPQAVLWVGPKGIIDLGLVPFDDVSIVPENFEIEDFERTVLVSLGHTYILITHEGYFLKFTVTEVIADYIAPAKIIWVYQDDDSRNFSTTTLISKKTWGLMKAR